MPALRGQHHFKRLCSQGGPAVASVYPESCSGGRLEEFCEGARVQDLQEILTWGENVQDTGKGLSIWCFYWGNSKIMWPKKTWHGLPFFVLNPIELWFDSMGAMVQALKISEKWCPHHVLQRIPGPLQAFVSWQCMASTSWSH